MAGIQKIKDKFYGLLQQLKPECENAGFKFTNLKKDQNYVWIQDSEGILGNSKAHFEFTRNGENVCVDIHFEEAKTRSLFYKEIGAVPQPLKWMEWKKVPNAAIRYSEYDLSEQNLESKLLKDLINFDKLIGDKVRDAYKYLKKATWYVKKAVLQDQKTVAIFKKAHKNFFQLKDLAFDEDVLIKVRQIPSDEIKDVKVTQKKDLRIYFENKKGLSVGDFIVYHRLNDGTFTVEFISNKDPRYKEIESKMANSSHKLFYSLSDNKNTASAGSRDMENKQPLNQILFGPPGTGKTYSSITRALNILGLLEWKEKYTKEEYSAAQELFRQELGNKIEFVTMHQSFSYEDFVQGLKPGKGKSGIEFSYENGVFKEICRRCREEITGDSGELEENPITTREIAEIAFFLSKFNGKMRTQKKGAEFLGYESDVDALEGIGKVVGMKSSTLSNHRDKFDFMFNDRADYKARKGWTPRNGGPELDETDMWPYRSVYNEMKDLTLKEAGERIKKILSKKSKVESNSLSNENFVIILDEINRANVSKVFGELITLIEDDKREIISTTLPSGEPFTVPENLYIIGTMNTADRSVSNMDIALRRRFEFIPLYPDSELVEEGPKRDFMEKINEVIREKGIDFQVGHADFMKDFDLIDIINNKTIPLLMEYYRNDSETVLRYIKNSLSEESGLTVATNKFGIPEVTTANTESES